MHTCDNPCCVNLAHLVIGTQRDNIIDSIQKGRYNAFGIQKLNAAQVLEIRALAARGFLQKDIAARFGIARNTVSGIVHRKSWQHVGPFVPGSGNAAERIEAPLQPQPSSAEQTLRARDAADQPGQFVSR